MKGIFVSLLFLFAAAQPAAADLVVGSKNFTESVILGEVIAQRLTHAGAPAKHQKELGGTRILWNALLAGNIDTYVEYTGTLFSEIFPELPKNFTELQRELQKSGIGASRPLGFNNTYALGMHKDKAIALGITKISELKD